MIKALHVDKSFGDPPNQVLFDVSFEVQTGSFVSITGKSGSGKSTLLYILSTLDLPSRGEIFFDGTNVSSLNEMELHEFRNLKMGFIFQFHYLLPELTALENVLMPTRKKGLREAKLARARELLKRFGIGEKWDRLPRQLSGGEQQRVAIARSMIMEPKYLFADEPTGNLDSANGEVVMNILKEITQGGESTVLYVTHDPDFAALSNHQIVLADGRVIKDVKSS
jgi:lipoprotein-releasing system ATP-binding protein